MMRLAGMALLLPALLPGTGCSPGDAAAPPELIAFVPAPELLAVSLTPQLEAATSLLLRAHLEQAEQDFVTAGQRLAELGQAIEAFLRSPEPTTLNDARNAWLQANMALETLQLHTYLGNQLFTESLRLKLERLDYRIRHWPVLPGYIDSVAGYGQSGLVHDITVPLTPAALGEQHGRFELNEAALGMHVLEFLLWGENSGGGGNRAVSDYHPVPSLTAAQQAAGLALEHLANNRRRVLLRLVTTLLQDDYSTRHELWRSGMTAFQARAVALNAVVTLDLLVKTMSDTLREELLLRSLFPLLNRLPDSLQAPYSDSTDNAVVSLLGSFEQLLLDTTAPDGTSLDSVLTAITPDFGRNFFENFDASKECLVRLYAERRQPTDARALLAAEYQVVDCINLLNNMIEHLQQVQARLRIPRSGIVGTL